jgi:hypothetical protein
MMLAAIVHNEQSECVVSFKQHGFLHNAHEYVILLLSMMLLSHPCVQVAAGGCCPPGDRDGPTVWQLPTQHQLL